MRIFLAMALALVSVVCLQDTAAIATGASKTSKKSSPALKTPPTQVAASEPSITVNLPNNLTIYTDKSGVVHETFDINLKPGINRVSFRNMPSSIMTGSVFLKFKPNDKNIYVLERTHSSNPSSLHFLIQSDKAERRKVELHYLIKDVRWRIFYVAILSPNQQEIDLNGWIQVDNQSGKNFRKAKVQLISIPGIQGKTHLSSSTTSEEKPQTAPVDEDSGLPYSYYLVEPIELLHNANKHISWAQAQGIKATQDYRILIERKYLTDQDEAKVSLPIESWISFQNTSESHGNVKRDLPAGFMTIYQRETSGSMQIVGTSKIKHTPAQGNIQFKVPVSAALGENVDNPTETEGLEQVTTRLQQTNYKKLSKNIAEASYQLTINNPTNSEISIKVLAELPIKGKWSITRESIEHASIDQGAIIWNLKIPAKTETALQYRLRLTRR